MAVAVTLVAAGACRDAPSPSSAEAGEPEPRTASFYSADFSERLGPRTFSKDGVEVTIQALPDEHDLVEAVAAVKIPGFQTLIVREGAGTDPGYTRHIGIGKLDVSDRVPSVILQNFTGGAHCCAVINAVVPLGNKLEVVKFPPFDGDGLREFPTDYDKDGSVDFILSDNSFLYAFSGYAASWPPPKILNVQKGRLVDVSARPGFAKLFEDFAKEARAECADRSNPQRNGACAGYVAASARLGRFESAMKEAEKLADASGEMLPERCSVETVEDVCPAGKEANFPSFGDALRWFLKDKGYLS